MASETAAVSITVGEIGFIGITPRTLLLLRPVWLAERQEITYPRGVGVARLTC